MKKLRNLVATLALAGIIMMGTTSANAGFLLSDYKVVDETPNPCSVDSKEKVDHGIIVNLTGIIVNLTGIIVNYKQAPTNCGIIVNKG